MESIALAQLAGDGLLHYNELISSYWPEFAEAGKEHITVADLMRHEAGLASLNVSIDPKDLLSENIKQNKIGNVLESHPARFARDGNPREYHAVTRGWVVNEIFRRVDPNGRTIGEYLREQISEPLGVDIVVGVNDVELDQRVPYQMLNPKDHLKESFKPLEKRGVKHSFMQLAGNMLGMMRSFSRRSVKKAPPVFHGMTSLDQFNSSAVAQGETPSANSHATARGLAKLAAAMANGGSIDGKSCLNQIGWEMMHKLPVERPMGFTTRFTQGGVNLYETVGAGSRLDHAANSGRDGFYGWMGLGGSLFQWHPELKIGFAFVPTRLHVMDFLNERGKAYQEAVLNIVR